MNHLPPFATPRCRSLHLRSRVRSRVFALIVAGAAGVASCASEPRIFPGAEWQKVAPSSLGWSSDRLDAAWERAKAGNYSALFVVQHGKVVGAYGDYSTPRPTRSIRKSLLSALYGIRVAEGKIDLQQTLGQLGIDDVKPLSAHEKSARIVDLITSRSGVYHDAAKQEDVHVRVRPARDSKKPGEHYFYNNWDFNALGTIYQDLAKASLFDDLDRLIAQPLQMEDFIVAEHTGWEKESLSMHPAYEIDMSARDLARFGLLYLANGKWGDRQIVPESWVRDSIFPHTNRDSDKAYDYGYMWWSTEALANYGLKERIFMARGNPLQHIIMLPELDLVIAMTVDSRLMLARRWLGWLPEPKDFNEAFKAVLQARPGANN